MVGWIEVLVGDVWRETDERIVEDEPEDQPINLLIDRTYHTLLLPQTYKMFR